MSKKNVVQRLITRICQDKARKMRLAASAARPSLFVGAEQLESRVMLSGASSLPAATVTPLYGTSTPLTSLIASNINTLVSFDDTNGSAPNRLIMDSSGNLYGATSYGGPDGAGLVYEIAKGSNAITVLASFSGSDSNGYPSPQLSFLDGSGNLYGTTQYGGADDRGTVFEIVKGSGVITALVSFDGTHGSQPMGKLVMDSSGNIFGTTRIGGANSDGTVFEIVSGSGSITVLASFAGANGSNPRGGVALDGSGNIYGTASSGGAYGDGTVFKIVKGSGSITVLASFNGTDGSTPFSRANLDSSGNLYGTTRSGGANGDGTVYEVVKGSNAITTLASFDLADGEDPKSGVILDSSGNLYGTTLLGGANNNGTVFEIVNGSGTITTLASFGDNCGEQGDNLAMDSSGNFYGVTALGGAYNDGTVFELSPAGAASQLVFAVQPTTTVAGTVIDPAVVVRVEDANGRIVTTDDSLVTLAVDTGPGGLDGTLTVAAVNGVATFDDLVPDTSGAYTLAASDTADSLDPVASDSFTVSPSGTSTPALQMRQAFNGSNGENPDSMVMGANGNLYGATDFGTIYEISPSTGAITTVASFNTGGAPTHGSVDFVDSGGNLYGTLEQDGGDGYGMVYEVVNGSGVVTTLATFSDSNGNDPNSLTVDGSGNLYGTTLGSSGGYGTVFEIVHGSGAITTLASFTGINGANPIGGLILDGNGNLYGTTENGGANDDGTIFEVVSGSDAITTLATFDATNGSSPQGGVVMDGSGNLYGTTEYGGANGDGTIFQLGIGNSTITTLVSFDGSDGAMPLCGVLVDNQGNLMGATAYGGSGYVAGNPASGEGTVFELPQGGSTLTTLLFDGADGQAPIRLVQGNNTLDGIARYGGPADDGVFFEAEANRNATQLVITQPPGDATAGVALTSSGGPVQVTAQDAIGNTVLSDDSTVTLSLSSGTFDDGLHVETVVVSSGVATFGDLIIDAAGSNYSLTASDGSLTAATSGVFNITAAAASKLVVTGQPASAAAGVAINPSVAVTVEDNFGNLVTTDSSSVTLTLSGSVFASGGNTRMAAAISGVATFGNLIIDAAGSNYSLTASDGSLTAATSGVFNITAAAASKLVVTGQPASAAAGVAINPSVAVTVEDNFGNLVTTDSSSVTLTLSGGVFASGGNTRTAAAINGVATFSNLVIGAAGSNYSLTASDGSLTAATSNAFNITAALAAKLAIIGEPSSAVAGVAISPAVTVAVQDAFGNPVTTDSSTVTLTLNSGMFAGGGNTVTAVAVNGLATFSGLVVDSPNTYSLNATDGALTGASSGSFTITTTTGTISGEVFNDTKGNGVLIHKDKGLSGVKVSIQLKKGKKLKGKATILTTNAKGQYSLAGLAPGVYQVSETVPSGYKQTAPASGVYIGTVVAGQILTGENFGNKKG